MGDSSRKILHIDMDAFYASVEQRDSPEFRGRPLVVGGSPQSRGVVAACSYEARKFGIHSAMPCSQAYRLCPKAVFVKPRFNVYRSVSEQIHQVFQAYTDLIEPLSLDEAYLDVTASSEGRTATQMATEIKQQIKLKTQLTASAGVSYNKFLAKIASDMRKPDGIFVIKPGAGEVFTAGLPLARFPGIGKVTQQRLMALGLSTGADLQAQSPEAMRAIFGKSGDYYYQVCRGIDHREVVTARERKSLSSETTYQVDLTELNEMLAELQRLAAEVLTGLNQRELQAFTLTIKVRYANFESVTRSRSASTPLHLQPSLGLLLAELLATTEAGKQAVRLLGVAASNLQAIDTDVRQLTLFDADT